MNDLSKRIHCSDGNCIGTLNEKGYCNVCGKPPKQKTDGENSLLTKLLNPSEEILYTIEGTMQSDVDMPWAKSGVFLLKENCICFCSNKGELCYGYSQISSIDIRQSWLGDKIITFYASGKTVNMRGPFYKGDPNEVVKILSKKIAKEEKPATQVVELKEDIVETIRKLAQLKDEGIISEEEFESKKKELLARL